MGNDSAVHLAIVLQDVDPVALRGIGDIFDSHIEVQGVAVDQCFIDAR